MPWETATSLLLPAIWILQTLIVLMLNNTEISSQNLIILQSQALK
jgi:hypothetical protein